jgi:hypothetical protein
LTLPLAPIQAIGRATLPAASLLARKSFGRPKTFIGWRYRRLQRRTGRARASLSSTGSSHTHPYLLELRIDAIEWHRFKELCENRPGIRVMEYGHPRDGLIRLCVACASEAVRDRGLGCVVKLKRHFRAEPGV